MVGDIQSSNKVLNKLRIVAIDINVGVLFSERHLATIAHQETTIEELQVESERLRMLLRENDKKLRETETLLKVSE